MRSFRSMIFAGLAMIACAMIVAPVEASVPIDPGIYTAPSTLDDHPAPLMIHADKSALTCEVPEVPEVPALASLRSSTAAASMLHSPLPVPSRSASSSSDGDASDPIVDR